MAFFLAPALASVGTWLAETAVVQTARTAVTSAVTTAGEYLTTARNVFKAGDVGTAARQAVADAAVTHVTKPITQAREMISDAGKFRDEMLKYGREKVGQFLGRKVENEVTDNGRDSGATAVVAAGKGMRASYISPKLAGTVKRDEAPIKGSKAFCGKAMKKTMVQFLERLGMDQNASSMVVSGLGNLTKAAGVGVVTGLMSEAMQDGDGPLAYGLQAMYGALFNSHQSGNSMLEAQMVAAGMGANARAAA